MLARIVTRNEPEIPSQYRRKTVETYSDKELKKKLCGAGCENCEVLDICQIGREWIRRKGESKDD